MKILADSLKPVKTNYEKQNSAFIKNSKKINPTIHLACILILSLSLTGLFTSFLAIFGIISHPLLSGQFGHWFLLNLGPIIYFVGNWLDNKK